MSSIPGSGSAGSPIEFDCQQCRVRLRVPSEFAGKKVRCSGCQSVQLVPGGVVEPSAGSTASVMSGASSETMQPLSMPDTGSAGDPFQGLGASSSTPATSSMASRPTTPNPAPAATSPVMSGGSLAQPQAPLGKPMGPGKRTIKEMLAASGKYESRETPTKKLFDRIVEQVGRIYVGQDELVLGTLVALFSNGHVLIESVPGLGKTLFVRTLGRILGCQFGRIQFTADLMPSDITGAPIFNVKDQEFRFRPGPVFTQVLLADEINRSPAKTHAALLEIMQEYRVTVDGTSHSLSRPFLVIATQNPVESEGTYNLPEAQLDRFMFKLIADYPTEADEARILEMHSMQMDVGKRIEDELEQVTNPEEVMRAIQENAQVRVDPRLVQYINRLVRATRSWPQFYLGASPRAGLALMQGARTLAAFCGRDYAVPDDVVQIALPVLRHRVVLTAEAEVEQLTVDELLGDMMRTIEVPRL